MIVPPERTVVMSKTCKTIREIFRHAKPDAVVNVTRDGYQIARKLGRIGMFCRVTRLDIERLVMNDLAARDLLQWLRTQGEIKVLNIAWIGLELVGGLALPDLLRVQTLTRLSIEGCRLHADAVPRIAEALSVDTTLTSLNMGFNKLGLGGATAVTGALHTNTSLTDLNLTRNHLGDQGIIPIVVMLAVNSGLRTLRLGDNDVPVGRLSVVLCSQRTLTELDLSTNRIGDEGAGLLAVMLHDNWTLERLYLSYNLIEDAGGRKLAIALRTNTTLTYIGLRGNRLGNYAGYTLAHTLTHRNTTVRSVDLALNHFSMFVRNMFQDATVISPLLTITLTPPQ
jgi:hypothetical protein